MLSLMIALAPLAAVVSSPATAVAAAYHDAVRIPAYDRVFMRYLWWPGGWEHTYLLTRANLALLSDQGTYPTPVPVKGLYGLYRIDLRQAGHDKRLEVWERFAVIDFVFHAQYQFLKDTKITVYYPKGTYDGKYYRASSAEVLVKKGKSAFLPAPWANPPTELGKGLVVQAQDELRKLLWTEVPILMGPFWLVRTSRQIDIDNLDHRVGYYNWFGVKNRNDIFKLTGVDQREALRLFQQYQAWVKSKVSEQERQIVLLRARTGWGWGTLDVFTQKGRGQPGRNLRPGEFVQDAEEWIIPLPNGLWFFALVAAKDNAQLGIKAGDLQESAPDKLGSDTSALNYTNDRRIHNGYVCLNCHGTLKDMVRPFEDLIRRKLKTGKGILRVVDPNVYARDGKDGKKEDPQLVKQELEALYLRDMNEWISETRRGYTRAVATLTSTGPRDPGLTVAGFANLYNGSIYQYISPKLDPDGNETDGVNYQLAAAELGVPPEALLEGLRKYNDEIRGRGLSDFVLDAFIETDKKGNHTPQTITRLAWEDSYQVAMMISLGLPVPEIVTKIKFFDGSLKSAK